MEDNTEVTDNTDVTGEVNDNSVTKGAGHPDTSKDDKQEKTLTQSEVNEVVKRAKADAEKAAKSKFEKSLEGKRILTEDEIAQLYKDWETEFKVKAAVDAKKAEFKSKGLTDEQLAVVPGDNVDDFAKNAEKIFGALLKKQAPQLNPGNPKENVSELEDLNNYLKNGLKRKHY